jgi:predicted nucleotidyltransferase
VLQLKDRIRKYLEQIEKEKNVTILLAAETGSRGWGFPSPDSDYDIRIIYKHHEDWYLSLGERKDTIEMMLENNDLDISGWDIRKALRLLWKSNPPLLERIQSPILYKYDEDFFTQINEIATTYYSRIATMHHYLNMAIKCYEDVAGKQEYKLKRFFYALRTASVCRWIMEKDEMPPIEFNKVLDGINLPSGIRQKIEDLVAFKAQQDESYLHNGEEELIAYIKESIDLAESVAKTLPPAKGNMEDLDLFFRQIIKKH